jgi:hypothetical protein
MERIFAHETYNEQVKKTKKTDRFNRGFNEEEGVQLTGNEVKYYL